MKQTPLFTTDCPSCGAPVEAHSATSVTLICGYCHSVLLRRDNSLTDSGRDSALLTDFSPLQVGTSGQIGDLPFTLIGRLQAQYDAGVWNEWHVLFADGATGWLSESGDLHVLLREAASPDNAPAFAHIRAGHSVLDYQDKRFIAADVRDITLQRAAAEGELPFELGETVHNKVSDWRSEAYFLTLDYESEPPLAFLGYGVSLDALNLQNLRSDEQIIASAGKLKGTRQAESCPNCGSPVEWIADVATSIICPSCASTIDASGDKAVLLEAGRQRAMQANLLTLPLGTQGTIYGKPYTVIGAVYKDEVGEPSGWMEYLLYSPQAGFLWLVQVGLRDWSLARTMNQWPRLDTNGDPQGAKKLFDYESKVRFAAGAFYWQVRSGDHSYHHDYQQGQHKLSAEVSAQEMSWSESRSVSVQEIQEWFGVDLGAVSTGGADNSTLSLFMIALFCMINIPAWLAMPSGSLVVSAFLSFIVILFLRALGGPRKKG